MVQLQTNLTMKAIIYCVTNSIVDLQAELDLWPKKEQNFTSMFLVANCNVVKCSIKLCDLGGTKALCSVWLTPCALLQTLLLMSCLRGNHEYVKGVRKF